MFLGLEAGVWVVLVVGGMVGIALVALLGRIDGKVSSQAGASIATVLKFLKSQENLLEGLLGEKYVPIYGAIVEALKSLVDSNVTEEEAVVVVNKALDAALAAGDAKLTEEQRQIVNSVILSILCKRRCSPIR